MHFFFDKRRYILYGIQAIKKPSAVGQEGFGIKTLSIYFVTQRVTENFAIEVFRLSLKYSRMHSLKAI